MTKMKYFCGAGQLKLMRRITAIGSHVPPGWMGVRKDNMFLFCLEERPLVWEQRWAYALTQQRQEMRTGTWPVHCHLEGRLRKVN